MRRLRFLHAASTFLLPVTIHSLESDTRRDLKGKQVASVMRSFPAYLFQPAYIVIPWSIYTTYPDMILLHTVRSVLVHFPPLARLDLHFYAEVGLELSVALSARKAPA